MRGKDTINKALEPPTRRRFQGVAWALQLPAHAFERTPACQETVTDARKTERPTNIIYETHTSPHMDTSWSHRWSQSCVLSTFRLQIADLSHLRSAPRPPHVSRLLTSLT